MTNSARILDDENKCSKYCKMSAFGFNVRRESIAKFSQSLDPHFIFVWYFPHNQIIKNITVTSNYAKFIKIYVIYLHINRNKKIWRHIDVTSKLELSGHSSKITNVHLRNSFLKFAFLPFRHMEK